jgi:hypothetical protein
MGSEQLCWRNEAKKGCVSGGEGGGGCLGRGGGVSEEGAWVSGEMHRIVSVRGSRLSIFQSLQDLSRGKEVEFGHGEENFLDIIALRGGGGDFCFMTDESRKRKSGKNCGAKICRIMRSG